MLYQRLKSSPLRLVLGPLRSLAQKDAKSFFLEEQTRNAIVRALRPTGKERYKRPIPVIIAKQNSIAGTI
jgi:hypothetical protein